MRLINVFEVSWENELPDINLSVVPEGGKSQPVLGVPFLALLSNGLESGHLRLTWCQFLNHLAQDQQHIFQTTGKPQQGTGDPHTEGTPPHRSHFYIGGI